MGLVMDAPKVIQTRAFVQSNTNTSAYETRLFVSKDMILLGFNGGSDRSINVSIFGEDDVKAFCDAILKAIEEGRDD